jgi:lysophospholipase L1-like esterase
MLALSVALALLLGESIARLVLDPVDYLIATPISDPILGRRLAPGASGHDQWGFRNREVPDRAEVVTIGDSQTYGSGVPRLSSWPVQLSELTGRRVYNVALGGYSPIEYYQLLRRYALPLKPSIIVVGFYFGNDLHEAYRRVYALPHYTALRRKDVPSLEGTSPPRSSKRFVRRIGAWLSGHSVLYRAALSTILQDQVQRAELILTQDDNDLVRLHHSTSSTSFAPAHRLGALDLDSLSVQEGLRLSLLHFDLMARLCDSAGVALFIALIPTKERVYQSLIDADPELRKHPVLRKVLAQEVEVDQRVRRFLQQRRISYIDLLPPLRDAVSHTRIYRLDEDGHPTAGGYSVIARELARAIAREVAGAIAQH